MAYLKAIVAAVGVVIMVVHAAASDQAISFEEANGVWLAIEALLTTVGVFAVRNAPG